MGSHKRSERLPSEVLRTPADYPQVYFDKASDFASIKLQPGIESKSYVKDGLLICENSKHEVIEIQILNVSDLIAKKSKRKKK